MAGLAITDSSEMPLSGRKVGVPEDDLAYDLDRRPGPAGISSRIAPEVMRADFKSDFSARYFDNLPGAGIAQGKNPYLGGHLLCSDILP